MAYVAVDKDESEWIHDEYPEREIYDDYWISNGDSVELPKGTIKKLIGRTLTWNDEPVVLKKKHEKNDSTDFLQGQKLEVERLLNLAKGHPLMESSLQGRLSEIEQKLKENRHEKNNV